MDELEERLSDESITLDLHLSMSVRDLMEKACDFVSTAWRQIKL